MFERCNISAIDWFETGAGNRPIIAVDLLENISFCALFGQRRSPTKEIGRGEGSANCVIIIKMLGKHLKVLPSPPPAHNHEMQSSRKRSACTQRQNPHFVCSAAMWVLWPNLLVAIQMYCTHTHTHTHRPLCFLPSTNRQVVVHTCKYTFDA